MPAVGDLDGIRRTLAYPRGVRISAVPRDHGHLGMRPQPGSNGLRQAILQEIHRAALLEIDHDRAITAPLPVGPVVDTDHLGGWLRSGLVVADAAQHGLTAARQALPRELAGARCPPEHEARVTLRLARPGGGVRLGA